MASQTQPGRMAAGFRQNCAVTFGIRHQKSAFGWSDRVSGTPVPVPPAPYNGRMRCARMAIALTLALCPAATAQTPQPFPRGQAAPPPAQPSPARPQPAPAVPPSAPAVPPSAPAVPPSGPAGEPTAQSLGLPVYPASQYLATYDAGRGQQYVLFGTTAAFAEIVTYYRSQLMDGGDQVFREPLTHTFDVGRFREETMVFPPGVT